MKNLHIISIAFLSGLICGLAVPAHANTLVCSQTVLENKNGVNINPGTIVVHTKPHLATIVFDGKSMSFPMNRVINDGWKKEDSAKLYEGKVKTSELHIAFMPDTDEPVTVQFNTKGATLIGMKCQNNK